MYKFNFSILHSVINIEDRDKDARSIIRNLEIEFRKRTKINQIYMDFLPTSDFFRDAEVEYSRDAGYFIRISPSLLENPDPRPAQKIVDQIKIHSEINVIKSLPPPISHAIPRITNSIEFDTNKYHYEAMVDDGGFLVLFHKSKNGDGFMTRHVPPVPIVEYQFEYIEDYKELFLDAKNHCSEFLDLSFLESEDVSKDTIEVFLRNRHIYGF